MNEDEDMSADGIAVCSVVEGESEEENDEPEQEQFDTVADAVTPVKKKKERKTFSIAHRWFDEGNAVNRPFSVHDACWAHVPSSNSILAGYVI